MDPEIVDLTNSAPSSSKANAQRIRTSVENALRPKPCIRKLSSIPDNLPSKYQLKLRPCIPGMLINPDGLPEVPLLPITAARNEQGWKFLNNNDKGNVPNENWTKKEHELLLMGVIRHGKGNWDKIANEFVSTKTPHQVSRYAEFLFKHFPATSLFAHNINKTKQLPAAAIMPREIDLNQTETTDLENSSNSEAPKSLIASPTTGSNSSAPASPNMVPAPAKAEVEEAPELTLPLFPEAPTSVEKSAPLDPQQPMSLRSIAEEPEPIKMTIGLPGTNDDEEGHGQKEVLNLDLTLGTLGKKRKTY